MRIWLEACNQLLAELRESCGRNRLKNSLLLRGQRKLACLHCGEWVRQQCAAEFLINGRQTKNGVNDSPGHLFHIFPVS